MTCSILEGLAQSLVVHGHPPGAIWLFFFFFFTGLLKALWAGCTIPTQYSSQIVSLMMLHPQQFILFDSYHSLMPLNCAAGEDSRESLGLQGQISQS